MQHTANALSMFAPVAEILRSTAQPPARGEAIAASLAELTAHVDPALMFDPQKVRLCYRYLATAATGDAPPVSARRATCGAIADALADAYPDHGQAPSGVNSAALWEAAVTLPGEGPRADAMRATARRELDELRDAERLFDGRVCILTVTRA